jgi:hypothetical protein
MKRHRTGQRIFEKCAWANVGSRQPTQPALTIA